MSALIARAALLAAVLTTPVVHAQPGKPAAPPRRPQEPRKPYPYAEEEVVFENQRASVKLAGTLTLPRGRGPFPAVLLVSGSGPQDRDETAYGHRPYLVLADYLTRRDVAVLRVDDRGVGRSTGDLNRATPADLAEDVRAGVAFLRSHPQIDAGRVGLVGHSEGALVATLAAARGREVAFLVLLAGSGLPGDEFALLQARSLLWASGITEEKIAAHVALMRRLFNILKTETRDEEARKKLGAELEAYWAKLPEAERKLAPDQAAWARAQAAGLLSPRMRWFVRHDPRDTLRAVRCPVLALGGEKDIQVPPKENLEAVRQALADRRDPATAVKQIPGLNHLFQTCHTGAIREYGKIEETLAPAALRCIGDWVEQRCRR